MHNLTGLSDGQFFSEWYLNFPREYFYVRENPRCKFERWQAVTSAMDVRICYLEGKSLRLQRCARVIFQCPRVLACFCSWLLIQKHILRMYSSISCKNRYSLEACQWKQQEWVVGNASRKTFLVFAGALLGRGARVRLLIGEVSLQFRQVGANNAEGLSRGENRRHRVNDSLPCRATTTPFLALR